MSYHSPKNSKAMRELASLLGEPSPAKAILTLRDSGWSMRGIARGFEVSFSAVRHCAARHGIEFPRRGWRVAA